MATRIIVFSSGLAVVAAAFLWRRRRRLNTLPSKPSRLQQTRAYIDTVADEDARYPLRDLYSRVRNGDGTLDNILTIHSLNPPALEAHYDLYARCLRGASPLTRVHRELVAVTVSEENQCRY